MSILLPVALILLPSICFGYNILALNMGGYWNNVYDQYIGAQAGYGTPGQAGERWYTMVDYGDLAGVNLMDYDVFLVQSGFTDDWVEEPARGALLSLMANRGAIHDFVAGGGGLVAWSEPFARSSEFEWGWTPVDVRGVGVEHENLVEVADPAHPVMGHSTDASLSNWQSSWHGWFDSWDPRLAVVAQTGDYGSGDARTHRALTLAGSYNAGGCGRMVFSMQDPDYHAYQGWEGARTLIDDALDWSACSQPVPEPASGLLAFCGLVAAGAFWRVRRRARS